MFIITKFCSSLISTITYVLLVPRVKFLETDLNVYLYIRNLENSHLKPVFRYTIIICICVGIDGYCVIEKLVLNVCIQDFRFTK